MMDYYEQVFVRTTIEQIAGEGTDVDSILECLTGQTNIPSPLFPELIDISGIEDALIGTPDSDLVDLAECYADLGVKPEWLLKQAPQHSVSLESFSLAKYAFTQLEWTLYEVDAAITRFEYERILAGIKPAKLAHPYAAMDRKKAEAYMSWLNCTPNGSYRLPTEYEWEYAATGGDGRLYPWGNVWETGLSNTAECGIGSTLPVHYGFDGADHLPNGLVQMAGNVEEMTATEFSFYLGRQGELDGFAESDPKHLITRGGSFLKWRDLATCQRRHAGWFDSAVGMRLAGPPNGKRK